MHWKITCFWYDTSMYKFFLLYGIFIILYHILHTLLVYWWWWVDGFFLAWWKDIVWIIGMCIFSLSAYFYAHRIILKKHHTYGYYGIFLLFLVLIFWSIFYSYSIGKSLMDVLIWFKYWIWPLVIVLSAILWWYSFYLLHRQSCVRFFYDTMKQKKLFNYIVYGIVWICGLWLLWQCSKVLFPELFQWLWYWAVGDYILWWSPPIWYRTWPWWVMRLQWLFAGPNNYWYFLVWVFPLILFHFLIHRQKLSPFSFASLRQFLPLFLVLTSLNLTLSRAAIFAVFLQILIVCWVIMKKTRVWLLVLAALGITALTALSFSQIKISSSYARIDAWISNSKVLWENPRWYWLWSSWPAIHHDWLFLPENQYMQILLDIWIWWFFLWMMIWLVLIIGVIKLYQYFKKHDHAIMLWLPTSAQLPAIILLWLFGIAVIWLFLHVLEDSMANYLVLWSYWVTLWVLLAHRDDLLW